MAAADSSIYGWSQWYTAVALWILLLGRKQWRIQGREGDSATAPPLV